MRVTGRLNGHRSIETHLDELGPGEIFGELSLIDGHPRAATVAALRRTRCLVLGQADFLELISRSAEFALALLRVEAERLRRTDSNLVRESPDALTGLPGRHALADTYERLAAGVRRRGTGLGLLLIDLDHLKPINDKYGHLAGDRALRRLSDVLRSVVRAADLVARWGGDEFVVLLSDATPAGVRKTATRIQRALSVQTPDKDLMVAVEASIGTVWSNDPPANLETLFAEADLSLRTAKRIRTRVRRADPPVVEIPNPGVSISD